jgi:CubicO group peptidase (beta-lactamase class C family)
MNRILNLGFSVAVAMLGGVLSHFVTPELVLAQSRTASAKVPGAGPEVERRVDQIFAVYDRSDSPGCALGVIQNGNFVYRKGYGTGSLELGVPLSPQSVFYMGSVSKQFTAASIVLASEQGFLSLDDNIRKYIPEIPNYGQPITLRQMLHHTSGIPDVAAMLGSVAGRNAEDLHPTAELMDLIARQKALNFNPGEQYLYSNTNYFLLAEVVKRATKKPLSEFAAENIFKPLGMTHTRFYDDHTLVVPNRVAAYGPGKEGDFLVDWSTNFDIVGAGGLMSSVDDLLMWDRNFYENKLGKGTLIKEMQSRGVLNNGTESNYALGLIMSTYRGLPIVEHDGANFGYRSEILRFPQQKFAVVTLCNASTADPARLAREVADLYLGKDLHPAPAAVAASGSDPAPFAGKYFDNRTHFLASFSVERGNLVLQGQALQPIEPNRFADPINGGTVTFSNSNGVTKGTVTYNNAITFEGVRIDDLHVDAEALADYAGVYKSSELDATYKLSVENGSLLLRMNWNPAVKLQAIIQNEFSAGGGITLVFRRDTSHHISGLSVFAGWDGLIRNENFEKLN